MSVKRCVQFWFLLQVCVNALHISETKTVYPKRHRREQPKNDLGTLNQPYTKVCGNGILEMDELCDCGTLEMCERNGDNCCEPLNCVFKASAQCSHKNNSECCSPSCLYKSQGTLCREANEECDLPEYCEGDKATCPDDKKYQNGVPCVFSEKIFRGITEDAYNSLTNTVSRLFPPITTRYLLVLPQKWNDKRPCLKLEFFGCSSEQDCDLQLPKKLSKYAYSTSSTFGENFDISENGWCPSDPSGSWVQIDFGEIVRIELIEMKISYWYTTWFTLYFSDNGLSWTVYSEKDPNKSKKSKSICFSGLCQLPLVKQCQTLPKSDGILCAKNKFCVNEKCGSSKEHGFKCPMNNEKECSGNGVCALDGTCVCNNGYSQTDNCLTKLEPINGNWGEWSNYTSCSKDCNGGIQKRYRFCSNPVPKYGGKECNGDSSFEKACNENPCPKTTRLTTSDDQFCIEPKTGDCSVPDNTVLVFRSNSSGYCKNDVSRFIFNPKTGSLLHKCSNKLVCSESGISSGSNMVISSACNESEVSSQIHRTVWKTLQIDTLCLNPSDNNLACGTKVQLEKCDNKNQILMHDLDMGDVTVSVFENYDYFQKGFEKDPKILPFNGFVDNFDFSPYNIRYASIRMQVYFRTPESGNHYFYVSCSDRCQLLLTADVSNIKSAKTIADLPKYNEKYAYQFNRYSFNTQYKTQESVGINLSVGKLYYLELIVLNTENDLTHAAVAVKLPNNSFVAPISYEYLSRIN